MKMKKNIGAWALLFCLLLSFAGAAAAETDVDYEISNYAMYVDIRADASARIREEVIYTCPHAYEGYSFFVAGNDAPQEIEVWADGTLLEEGACTLEAAEGGWIITLSSPGDNDWRTFACAYTVADYACRYQDTALIDRMLVAENHAVVYQNATVIVTMPEDSGEILVYPRDYSGEVRSQYSQVSFGPLDLDAGEGVSAQLLFPEEWLSQADVTNEAVREEIVSEKTRIQEEKTRLNNTLKRRKRIAGALYLGVFAALLIWEIKKYGLSARRAFDADWTLVDRYPAHLTGFVVGETADSDVLTGTLAELSQRGVLEMEGSGAQGLTLTRHADNHLSRSEQAALDYVFNDHKCVRSTDLSAPDYARAHDSEGRLKAYADAVAAEAEKADLKRRNENELIAIGTASILCGLTLTIIMLMLGEMMIFEGAAVSVGMFVMMKQYNRVRHLTDQGEQLKMAASVLIGMDDGAQSALRGRPGVAAALGAADAAGGEEASRLQALSAALREAHVHNAGMRKKSSRIKKSA